MGQLGEREPKPFAHELLKLWPMRGEFGGDCRMGMSYAAIASSAP